MDKVSSLYTLTYVVMLLTLTASASLPTTDQPITIETITSEASRTESTTTEPTTIEPATTEATRTETITAEATTTTEPTTTEPTTIEPTTTEPTTTESTTTETITAKAKTTEPTTTTEATTTEETTPPKPKAVCEITFGAYDTNRDQKISIAELKVWLYKPRNMPDDDEIKEDLDEADTNGDGAMDLEEYCAFKRKKVAKMFRRTDINHNKKIDVNELVHKLREIIGHDVQPDEARDMLHKYDNHYNDLDKDEFTNMLMDSFDVRVFDYWTYSE